jgi:nucleotide-binding universal stress UspA family protein
VRILVAVDGSAGCEAPLHVLGKWVGIVNADVYLLQVIDGFTSRREHVNHGPRCVGCTEAEVLAMRKARTYLDELVSRYELPADCTRCLVCRNSDAAEEIITIAQNNNIDLIVMSSHYQSWLGQLSKDSVCSEVVSPRDCSVPFCVCPWPAHRSAVDITQ